MTKTIRTEARLNNVNLLAVSTNDIYYLQIDKDESRQCVVLSKHEFNYLVKFIDALKKEEENDIKI